MVIVGSGVGGTLVANRLARSHRVRVTVLNAFEDHLNQPANLYLPFGERFRVSAPARALLSRGVRFRCARAISMDPGRRQVVLEGGERIAYDMLVVATGSRPVTGEIPGFKEGAHHFHCRFAANLLARALSRFQGGRIVVGATRLPYKCPPSPHEFAFLLHEYLIRRNLRGRTEIIFVYPCEDVFPKAEVAHLLRPMFAERGIRIETGFLTTQVGPGPGRIVAQDGREIQAELLVLVPPHTGAGFVKECGWPQWIPVDPKTLRVGERIYALGDAVDLPVPKSGAATHAQAEVVAANVLSEIEGKEPGRQYDGRVT